MGMGPCPTGYCGHPCTCPSAYDHTQADDAKIVIGILQARLTKLAEDKASKELGEPMVEYATKKAVIKVLRCDHAIHQVDIQLHVFIPNLNPEAINALSGMRSIFKDGDTFTTTQGYDPDAIGWVSYEIVNYKGEVSVQHVTKSTAFPDLTAYISLVDGKTYLPKDVV